MVTAKEVLMGRDEKYTLTKEQIDNLFNLLPRINFIRFCYAKPLIVSSGYRPGEFNSPASGATKSSHLVCRAVDFVDSTGEFAKWCLDNVALLEEAGLYLEDPKHTIGWVHLQSTPTKSNPFIP